MRYQGGKSRIAKQIAAVIAAAERERERIREPVLRKLFR